jgi:hypothetical protein
VTFERGSHLSVLGQGAFSVCQSLRSICIPASIDCISKSCFADCETLSDFKCETGCSLSSVGEFAFQNCVSLQSICLPASIEQLYRSSFDNCPKLMSVVLESGGQRSVCALSDLVLDDAALR